MPRDSRNAPRPDRPHPEGLIGGRHGRTAIRIARVSLAIYFLLSATGMVSDPVIRMLFDGYALDGAMLAVLKGSVMIAATMVLFGAALRPAALYLAVFLIWSAGLQANAHMTDDRVAALIGALALFAGMVLVAIDAPQARVRRRRRSSTAPVQPRRVAPARVMPIRGQRLRGLPRGSRPASVSAAEMEETSNLFADIWEEAA